MSPLEWGPQFGRIRTCSVAMACGLFAAGGTLTACGHRATSNTPEGTHARQPTTAEGPRAEAPATPPVEQALVEVQLLVVGVPHAAVSVDDGAAVARGAAQHSR